VIQIVGVTGNYKWSMGRAKTLTADLPQDRRHRASSPSSAERAQMTASPDKSAAMATSFAAIAEIGGTTTDDGDDPISR
jgi:hypothetical protein